jgi:malate synthase
VPIDNLMEDAATAEICRTQIWQWVHHQAPLDDGRPVTAALVKALLDEEMARLAPAGKPESGSRFAEARVLFETVALADPLQDFLTLPAYERMLAGGD